MLLRAITYPVPVSYYRAVGLGLRSCCEVCGHEHRLDLDEMLERFGLSVTVVDLHRLLSCAECNSDRPLIALEGHQYKAQVRKAA